jgi:thiol-disulfide isomerase/thioredoxin
VTYDGFDTTAITIKDIYGNDVTNSSTIYINGSIATSSTFIASSLANATVYATRNSLTSITKTIFVIAATSPFTKKLLVEHFTGTWCGYCPRVTYALDQYALTHPNLIIANMHGYAGTSDPFIFQYESQLSSNFSVTGYPTAIVNRYKKWDEVTTTLNNELSKSAPLGLAIQSSINGTTITGTASVKFNVTTSKTMKIVVLLVENGLVKDQINYFSPSGGATPYLYGGANPIVGFVHNGVMRKASTDIFGDLIPASAQIKSSVWNLNFSMTTSGTTGSGSSYTIDPTKCSIIAYVVDGTTAKTGVYNVQTAPVGTIKNFD